MTYFRVEYIQLAAEYKPAVNLGQGFPDYHAPDHVTKALANVATGENPLLNQYTRGFVSKHYIILKAYVSRDRFAIVVNLAIAAVYYKKTMIFQGHPRLVQNLAKLYSPLIGRELDPINEILVTSGAYEALFSAILGKHHLLLSVCGWTMWGRCCPVPFSP